MKPTKNKPFELNILGLIKLKCEDWSFGQILIIVGILVTFLFGFIFLLKIYALPFFGLASIKEFIGSQISTFIKSKFL